MFYKIVSDGCVVDATTSPNYVRWQEKNRLFLSCGVEDAQGIATSDGEMIYLLDGAPLISGFKCASVSEITEEEYLTISAQLNAGSEIVDPGQGEAPDAKPKTKLQALEERLDALAEGNALLTACILELSALIYG